jgi:hypothetical protein
MEGTCGSGQGQVEGCCECGNELSGCIKFWKPRPSPEDGNRPSFRNAVFSSYLDFQTIDKVLKPGDSERRTPSSEPFRNQFCYCYEIL